MIGQDVVAALRENQIAGGKTILALMDYEVLQEKNPSKRFEKFVGKLFAPEGK